MEHFFNTTKESFRKWSQCYLITHMEGVVKDRVLALLPAKDPHTAKKIPQSQRRLHIFLPELQSNAGRVRDLLT